MSSTQERAISVAAVRSTAAQFGSEAQRRQLALERYVAAVAGDRPPDRHASSASRKSADHLPDDAAGVLTVAGAMTAEVVSLPSTATFRDVLHALAAHAVSAIPVVDQDGVAIGVVSEADLLAHVVVHEHDHSRGRIALRAPKNRPAADLTAGDLMSSPAVTTTPDSSITEAATVAARAHVKVLPVVDLQGRPVGTLSRADLLRAYSGTSVHQ